MALVYCLLYSIWWVVLVYVLYKQINLHNHIFTAASETPRRFENLRNLSFSGAGNFPSFWPRGSLR
jgi:hypothetical protein